jgi:hypothetical protein
MAIAMDVSNAPPMQQSYPSPTAGPITDGNGPFFNQQQPRDQQRLPDPDSLQLAAQLSRSVAPQMAGATDQPEYGNQASGQTQAHEGIRQEEQLPQSAQQPYTQGNGAHSGNGELDPSFGGGDPTAPRKRSKVSRACDECRRKKVSLPFLFTLHHSISNNNNYYYYHKQ